jgi:hypothetical protein
MLHVLFRSSFASASVVRPLVVAPLPRALRVNHSILQSFVRCCSHNGKDRAQKAVTNATPSAADAPKSLFARAKAMLPSKEQVKARSTGFGGLPRDVVTAGREPVICVLFVVATGNLACLRLPVCRHVLWDIFLSVR